MDKEWVLWYSNPILHTTQSNFEYAGNASKHYLGRISVRESFLYLMSTMSYHPELSKADNRTGGWVIPLSGGKHGGPKIRANISQMNRRLKYRRAPQLEDKSVQSNELTNSVQEVTTEYRLLTQ